MKKSYKILVAALFAFGIQQSVNAQLTIMGAGAGGYAGGVSDNGVVSIYTSGGQVFKWDAAGGQVQIGAVSNGYPGAGQAHISTDGKYISYVQTNADGFNVMSLYNVATGTWSNLGGLVESGWDGYISSAWNISKNGDIVVGLGMINGGTGHAIKWDAVNGIVDLGSTVEGRSSRANGVSDDGSVIVGWQDASDGFRQGARWVNGVQDIIKDGDGNPLGEIGGVSGDGKFLIGYSGFNPFVWSETGGVVKIEHPNAGPSFRGGATSISGDGSKVIGFFRPWPGPPTMGEGFIWTAANGRQNLNDYATSLGIDTQGVTMSLPLAISHDGLKIVGTGMAPSGPVTFLLDLTNFLGTQEATKTSTKLSVYPNPVKDILHLNAKNVTDIEIYSLAGQKLKTLEKGTQLNVSNLPKGMYILKAKVEGNPLNTKFIKE